MAEGKMKLYGIASSTCTGRVLVTLFEKEVEDFELQVVNVRKGEGKTPEHMALQPFGLIPVLQDGDLTLFEIWSSSQREVGNVFVYVFDNGHWVDPAKRGDGVTASQVHPTAIFMKKRQ